ncbi:MAG: serine/threonine protein kinase, partial [Planctomycetes bacterium]|nr:serine/threonine protein kinase [Planctomycetota bacterium]
SRDGALKLIRPELLYFPGSRERFRREVEVVARLQHPGIVPVYSVDDDGDVPHFAMEWIDGQSVEELLRALRDRDLRRLTAADFVALLGGDPAQLPPAARAQSYVDRALELVRDAALALQHAHERGVLHRDLKPSNLMVARDGRVRLVDFGLASTEGSSRLTRSGAQLGSLPFMSPEQLERGAEAVTARSDVYSLGVVLFELLAGRAAYDAGSETELRRQILASDHPPLRTLNPSISWEVETIALKAMESDPARRYASAADFAADLDHALRHEPIAARRASPALRLRRFAQRRPALAVGVTLGTLLLVGGPTVWAFQERRLGKKLEEQLDKETKANAVARRSAARARAAVNEFLTTVADKTLNNVPGSEEKQRTLHGRALELFEEILAEDPGDPDLQLDVARTFLLAGHRIAHLGDKARGEATFTRALALLEASKATLGNHPNWRRARAEVLVERAAMQRDGGEALEPVIADMTEAAALLRELLAAGPDPAAKRALVMALNLEANSRTELGQPERAIASFAEMVALQDELRADSPSDLELAENAASLRANLGSARRHAGELAAAEADLRVAIAEFERLLKVLPSRTPLRFASAGVRSNLAILEAKQGRVADGAETLRGVVADFEKLAAEFPQAPIYRRELASDLLLRAEYLPAEAAEEAIGCIERAQELIGALEPALAQPRFTAALALAAQRQLGERLYAAGDPDAGLEALQAAHAGAREHGKESRESGDALLLATAAHALASTAAAEYADADRAEHEREALAALERALEQAVTREQRQDARELLLEVLATVEELAKARAMGTEELAAIGARCNALLPGDAEVGARVAPWLARS